MCVIVVQHSGGNDRRRVISTQLVAALPLASYGARRQLPLAATQSLIIVFVVAVGNSGNGGGNGGDVVKTAAAAARCSVSRVSAT